AAALVWWAPFAHTAAAVGGISGAVSTAAERANREAGHAIVALVPGSYDQRCRIQTDADVAGDPLTAPFQPRIGGRVLSDTDDRASRLFATRLTDEGSVDALFDAYTPGGVDPNVP